jgi:ketosteroid isomerase-like protein
MQPDPALPSADQRVAASDVSAVRRVGEGYLAAIRSGDVDAMMAHWGDHPTLLPPNAPGVRGRDEVRAWAQAFQKRVRVTEARFTESEVTIGGDLAAERLAFTMTLEPAAGGAPMILTGKGVHLYRRQADGDWKLSLDIWNADNSPAS